jgi:hypothetical protein
LAGAVGQNGVMASNPDASLGSMAAALDEIQARIAAIAESFHGADRDDLLAALHEAERQVRSAGREIQRSRRLLR